MPHRKRIFTKEEREYLHKVFPTTPMLTLCTIFHVGAERMREILREEGLTVRMQHGWRKVRPVSVESCANCKSFSGRKGIVEGWCLKRKMRVLKRDSCSEHAFESKREFVI